MAKMNNYTEYHIAQNLDIFDASQPDRQNLTHQNFKALQCLQAHAYGDRLSKYFMSNI